MKYLGIDYGTKRIGLATSDEAGGFAFPYKIIEARQAVKEIVEIITKEHIEEIIVGESRATNDQLNDVAKDMTQFVEELKKHISIPVSFIPEGHSSVEAYRYQQTKGPADDRAAAIILQRHLDKKGKGI